MVTNCILTFGLMLQKQETGCQRCTLLYSLNLSIAPQIGSDDWKRVSEIYTSATANRSDGALTCLIDRLEESFDLHVAWSSIDHLSADLENTKPFLSVADMLEKHVTWTFAAPYSADWQVGCPQADSAVHWPDSDSEHELNNVKAQKMPENLSVPLGIKYSPPLYCCPPPLHPESPASQAQGGSQAKREGKKYIYINIKCRYWTGIKLYINQSYFETQPKV